MTMTIVVQYVGVDKHANHEKMQLKPLPVSDIFGGRKLRRSQRHAFGWVHFPCRQNSLGSTIST